MRKHYDITVPYLLRLDVKSDFSRRLDSASENASAHDEDDEAFSALVSCPGAMV